MKWHYLLLITSLSFCANPKEKIPLQIEDFESPTAIQSSLPYFTIGNDDQLYFSWVEKGDSNRVFFKYSRLDSDTWSVPELIAQGTNWFVNWADYPMIAVDKSGNKIAHYLAKSSSGTYSYNVNLVLKNKDSSAWSSPIIPHSDGTPTEHGFVTMLPNDDGSFTIAWLDGRYTGGGDHSDHGSGGPMTLRTAVLDHNGAITEETELDGRVCDCCQTSGIMTRKGPLFVYRDRSVDEVRDMAYVSKVDNDWQKPKLVAEDNWSIEGCPVNGPRMASTESTSAVAWYTAALNRPKVKVAFMAGEDFNEPIIVDDSSPVGRVDIAMINDHTAIVSWMDGGERPAIKYRKVNQNGSMSPVYIVVEISAERGSGFPQMAVFDQWIYFAWTETEDIDQIKMKRVALD